jgi:hypothetical protein
MAAQRIRYDKMPSIPGALRNLGNWMASEVRGNEVDDRPPIYEDVPREQVMDMLKTSVNRHADLVTDLNARVPGFSKVWSDVEKDQAANLGPSSMYASYLLDGASKVDAVYSDKPLSSLHINRKALQLALARLETLLPARSIRMTSMKAARPSPDATSRSHLDGTTNAGYPAWLRGWWQENRKDDAHMLYRSWLEQEVEDFVSRCARASKYTECVPRYIATLGQRVVPKGPNPLIPKEGKYKGKRFVIAMPKTETWPGKMIFSPMQEALLKVRNTQVPVRVFSGWTKMPVLDKNMQMLLENAAKHRRTVLSGDLSSFDASIPPELWWMVKLAMSKWMDDQTARMYLAIGYADIYGTELITPTKWYPAMASSMKSGSMFTNVEDSCVNLVAQWYGFYSGYYGDITSAVNGDDLVVDGDGVTPLSMAQAFSDLGMTMNTEKQFCEPNCLHFLQRLHCLGLPGGMGSVARVLTKCLSVEDDSQLRYDERNKYAYAVQAISRLENACFNPEFAELVNLVAAGDRKFHLGSSLPPHTVAAGAGEYAKRKFESGARNVWSPEGSGVPFAQWATNRVLRGETLPPPGLDRWKAIYGISYSSVSV